MTQYELRTRKQKTGRQISFNHSVKHGRIPWGFMEVGDWIEYGNYTRLNSGLASGNIQAMKSNAKRSKKIVNCEFRARKDGDKVIILRVK